ncbi:ABC transporter ATP-binding protein [Nocardioides piscis]|uniref:ABC transporter ATP-binding protein n=1 Tax=Nocardioides piscis TaxID=2714938 RepID=A0A6G7YDN9_9ACTN|nr:ABC transporter ATP-binding protein [Nocardioides piscis]QIK74890.1 ABC transporter ATP-binding protein [Nocardioides piscis]
MILEVERLHVTVPGRPLLDDGNLCLRAGETAAIVGPSGSGKTSLLNAIAGLHPVDAGRIIIEQTEVTNLNAKQRARFRLSKLGLVFQFGELLPELSAVENVALHARLLGWGRAEAEKQGLHWLDRMGMASHAHEHPASLSGGEIQRVALARALVHRPVLILADEPTGMLDEENTKLVVDLLMNTAADEGAAVLLTTHDLDVAAGADHCFRLTAGALHRVPGAEAAP